MKISIVTSGDYIYAGNVFLHAKSMGHSVSFVDVSGPQSDILLKKFKLVVLFGFFKSLLLFFSSIHTKKIIKKSGNLQTIKKINVESILLNGDFDLIILVNYAWLFPTDSSVKILNCHPSLLPKYRGLMPISHMLNKALINKLTYIETGVTIHQIDDNFDMDLYGNGQASKKIVETFLML